MINNITELIKFLIDNFPTLSFIMIAFTIMAIVVKNIVYFPLKFLEKSTANFVSSLLQFCILFSSIPFILWYYSFDQLKIWAFVALVSTAAAIAITSKFRDLFSGMFIYLMNYYRIDEKVTLNGYKGKVVEFNIFNTVIQTRDGDLITLSNSEVNDKVVVNHSKSGFQRCTITLPISNYEDRNLIKTKIIEVLKTFDFIIYSSEIAEIYTRFDGTQEFWDIYFNIKSSQDVIQSKGRIVNFIMQIPELKNSLKIINYYERNN